MPLAGSAAAVTIYNHRLAAHPGLATAFLAAGDGVALSVRLDEDRKVEVPA